MRLLLLALILAAPLSATSRWIDLGSGTLPSTTCFPDTTGGPSGTSLNFGYTSLCPGRLEDWTGGIYDTSYSRLVTGMGGHAGYLGNEFVVTDMRTHTSYVTAHPSPFNISGTGSVPCTMTSPFETYCDGTPGSRHTYNGLVYLPDQQVMLMFGGGLTSGNNSSSTYSLDLGWPSSAYPPAACVGTPGNTPGTFNTLCQDSNLFTWICKNQATCTVAADWASLWTQKATVIPGTTCNEHDAALYEAGKVIFLLCNGQFLQKYDYIADSYTTLPSLAFSMLAGQIVADQSRGILILVGAGTLGFIYMDGHDSYVFHDESPGQSSGPCGALFPSSGFYGFYEGAEMDPNDNKLVVIFPGGNDGISFIPGDNTVYIFDPSNWSCTTELVSGGPPPLFNGGNGLLSRWRYSPSEHGFVISTDINVDVFLYQRDVDVPTGLGHSTLASGGPCLDLDGDGYGVGAGCLGPDADDFDPAVHSTAQVISTYGPTNPINNFLIHRKIQFASTAYNVPANVYCISTTGNDSTGTANVVSDTACTSTPFQTYNGAVAKTLTPPYIILYRAGTYTEQMNQPPGGTAVQRT